MYHAFRIPASVPCLLIAVAIASLSSCHGSSDRVVNTTTTVIRGNENVFNLSLTRSGMDVKKNTLHWQLKDEEGPVGEFRIYSSPVPLTVGNRLTYLLGTVPGNLRQFDLLVERDVEIRYLTITAFRPDGTEGSQSLSLPIDTQSYLAYSMADQTDTELWLAAADGSSAPTEVAADADNVNWSTGRRSLLFRNVDSNRASRHYARHWPTDMTHATTEVALPNARIKDDWFSMRASAAGTLAYRGLDGSSTRLFVVKDGDGTPAAPEQVSEGSGDVQQFAWSPVGPYLAYLQTGSNLNQHLHLFDAATSTRTELSRTLGTDEYVLYADWAPNGKWLAFVLVDAKTSNLGELFLHDIVSGSTEKIADEFGHALAWAPNSAGLACTVPFVAGRQKGTPPTGATVQIAYLDFPTQSGAALATQLKYPFAAVESIVKVNWSPDSKQLSFVLRSKIGAKTMTVFNPRTGAFAGSITWPIAELLIGYEWNYQGTLLACRMRDNLTNTLRVYDFSTGAAKIPATEWASGKQITYYTWAPQSDRLAAVMGDGVRQMLYLLDGGTPTLISTIQNRDQSVTDVVWAMWTSSSRRYIYSRLVFK